MARYFMGDTRRPMRAQRSGSHGERRSSTVSEPCRLRRGEGYGALGVYVNLTTQFFVGFAE